MFGLFPRKQARAVGYDADLVLFVHDREHTISPNNHHLNGDFSLYKHCCVIGKLKKVLLTGGLILNDSQWLGRKGSDKYQKRSTASVL